MRACVFDNFWPFTSALEGVVPWMYLDVLGLVTVAIGNLIDTPDSALALPFVYKGTTERATRDAILREWSMVKAHKTAARDGHRVLETETSLRLTPDGVRQTVMRRLELNEQILRGWFPEFELWPADAQLAGLSMAWACGANFPGDQKGGFPRLRGLLRAADFAGAVRECHMREDGNPGLVPRNVFAAAAAPADEDAVSWHLLAEKDPRHFPPRPEEVSVLRPEQLMSEAPIVRPRVPLPDRD
jgi:hypothetical protein